MLKFYTFLLVFLSISLGNYAQDDLLSMFDEEETTDYTTATFKATKVILGQSVEQTKVGNLAFMVQHQFGPVNGGAYELWGLDQANIRLGFDYGLKEWWTIGIGRASYKKTFDGTTKIRILRQSKGKKKMPLTLTYNGGVFYNSTKWSEPDRDNHESSRFSYLNQVIMARKFSERISIQLTSSLVHRNLVATSEEEHDVITIAPAGRVKISNRVSFNFEYFWLVPGHTSENFEDALNIGFDIETGGHVFQLYVTNAQAIQEPYFMAETIGKWSEGDVRLAFNLYRSFVIYRPKDRKDYEEEEEW